MDIKNLEKTGVIKELLSAKGCVSGTVDEVMSIDGERSVVFRTVCKAGLNELGLTLGNSNNKKRISVRKTLNIILRDKKNDGTGYHEETMASLVSEWQEYKEDGDYNAPLVIDAEASDDGSFVRLLCRRRGDIRMYNFDLDKKNWRDKKARLYSTVKFTSHEINPGAEKQMYFLFPDVIFFSTESGMEIAERVTFHEGRLMMRDDPDLFKRGVYEVQDNGFTTKEGVYWNKVGSVVFLESRWLCKDGVLQDGTSVYVPWRQENDPNLPDTPPVPTEKDWEGWHKLERTANN